MFGPEKEKSLNVDYDDESKKEGEKYFGDGVGRKSGLRPSTKSNPWELALQISSCTTQNNWYNFLQLRHTC